MALNCGIVGLPNVGKSTIFSSLCNAPAEAANYPFCTIEPNVGIVPVPDERLDKICGLVTADKKIFATIEFVDIAGLVAGASRGEGLGNKFLANVRQTGMIAHVVRCFDDDDVIHVAGKVDPLNDIAVIETELALSDLETVNNRIEKNKKALRSPDKKVSGKAAAESDLLEKVRRHLDGGAPARTLNLSEKELEQLADLFLITLKKEIYVCNIDEDAIGKEDNAYVKAVKAHAAQAETPVIVLCGKLEAEISQLTDAEERRMFLDEAGITETGLQKLARTAYHMLGLRTFFTVGKTENRAWTFREGFTAPQAAGVIHSDFEKGFIKAETYNCADLFELGSEAAVKAKGRLRQEGKDYIVNDGDIMFFKFNL
jgi:GTP-binding protein YchF